MSAQPHGVPTLADRLKEGLHIALGFLRVNGYAEPGIYLDGIGGIRHSDTVLITRDGYECLTRYPTDLPAMTLTARKPLNRLRGALMRRAAGVR